MPIDERARHRLFLRLEEVLGPDEAAVMMEHLPPVGWADVATKHDLDAATAATKHDIEDIRRDLGHLETGLRSAMQSMEARIKAELTASFRADMIDQTRHLVRWMIIGNGATIATIAGIAFAAARLT